MIKSLDYNMIKKCNSSAKVQNDNKCNLPVILELIHINNTLDVQLKLFSILSSYLISKDADTYAVITCNHIYDKINEVLANSPPRKTAVGLNFLTALLYLDEEHSRGKNVALYSRNMIRASGCLATMCDMFTSSMIYQDTWRALCRCLAEACREIEPNQSYCTHLVPVCVQRCSQRNVDAFRVLTSLLHNHNRNIKLFIDCNGASLFTREFLQYEACLELLATLAQSSAHIITLVKETDIDLHLRDFLRLYGPNTPLGQWATIILYHTSRLEVPSMKLMDNEIENTQVLNETLPCFISNGNDTTVLFQNVMNEILQGEPKGDLRDLKNNLDRDVTEMQHRDNFKRFTRDSNNKMNRRILKPQIWNTKDDRYFNLQNNATTTNKGITSHWSRDLSFSFLHKQMLHKNNHFSKTGGLSNTPVIPAKLNVSQRNATTQTHNFITLTSDLNELRTEAELQEHSDINDFKPVFASTPKRKDSKTLLQQAKHSMTYTACSSILKTVKQSHKQRNETKKSFFKRKVNQVYSERDKDVKNRSISTRFFEAINESCTTLVKTVKNMFVSKPKPENTETTLSHTLVAATTLSCNYSFTNYMQKRDAVLLNEKSKYSSFEVFNSCNTCNDTMVLKRKLANDEYLKETVKKLKVGVNLYGCDFKKISRILWPYETYMTPAVLYHLYRKLIMK